MNLNNSDLKNTEEHSRYFLLFYQQNLRHTLIQIEQEFSYVVQIQGGTGILYINVSAIKTTFSLF